MQRVYFFLASSGYASPVGPRRVYEFGSFRLDAAAHVLWRSGEVVSLKPKIVETLLVLVEAGGRVVGKEELLKAVWPDTLVEEGNLAHNISVLRKTLGHACIETIPKRGYRFPGEVQVSNTNPAQSLARSYELPPSPVRAEDLQWPLLPQTRRRRVSAVATALGVSGICVALLFLIRSPSRSTPNATFAQVTDEPNTIFRAQSWSPKGGELAGNFHKPDGSVSGTAIYSLDQRCYRRLTEFGAHPCWLSDGRRLLFRTADAIYLANSQTNKVHEIFSVAPHELGTAFTVSRDDRQIFFTAVAAEADVWVMSLP